ncbi:unnamed protein product [Adineta ricciae]|uniref:Protein kinase domain-containing protein n=1 Tax=Adineta ricciae TaxID=249248 RepID=A0A814KPI4_ADIRI|nr:unnamed protein product [Adineta ricciae]CAF1054859.1 unnamed protein product [Adineta ricciae]
MEEEEEAGQQQQQQQQVNENLPTEQTRWIAGTILVEKIEDLYDLDDLINHGQFADVYKCRLKNRQTIRVVKCIPKRGSRRTPLKNASHVLQLDHSNLVVLREILESQTHIYIVQDYINGPNLFQKIARMEVYTEHDLSKYCLQILKGLEYLHEHKVYHGKLHGENIIIREGEGESKLCLVDYAYANICTRDAINLLVNATPSFCAPEILRGEPYSPSSDMWQLGILIYFCFTAKYPFHGIQKEIFQKILKGVIEYDAPEWEHVSVNGKSFVNKLLKVNVRDRLTVNQAFSQPWIREKVYRADTLSVVQAKIAATLPVVPETQPNDPDAENEDNDTEINEN